MTLSTAFSGKAALGDADVGGNDNSDAPPVVPWVVHTVDKVLLPVSSAQLKQLLLAA